MDINSLKERILELFLIENIENYKEYSIGDLLIRYKEPIIIEDDKEYKRVTIKNKNRGICLRDIEKGSNIKTKRQFLIKEGLFLMSKIDARNGAFGISSNKINLAIITNSFLAYETNNHLLNMKWFNFYVATRGFIHICEKSSSGTTNRKNLNEKEFLNFKINLPSLEDQEIAVSKIEELFALIDILSDGKSSTLINIKNARDKILSLAIQGKLVEQDTNDTPASELLLNILEEKEKLIKEKKLKREKPLPPINEEEKAFDLPVGWEWCRLGDIGTCQTGTTPHTNIKEYFGGNIPFIKPPDISNKGINYNNESLTQLGLGKGRMINNNSVLMVCIGSTIGKSFFTDRICSCNQQINSITPFCGISKKMIFYIFNSNRFMFNMKKFINGSVAPIIKKSNWERIPIPLPPLQEQHRIVAKIEELFSLLNIIENQLKD